jgi:ElaB/YqjD/DUF883 family membrane-anchored ribosome-binding protein
MDNQKPQQGNGSNFGSEGSGSSMGKDLSKDLGSNEHITSKTVGFGNLDHGIDKPLDKTADKVQDKPLSAQFDNQLDKSASDMHKTIDKAAQAAQPMADRLATSAHANVDKAAQAAQPMADRLATTAHASVDKVSSALTGASARLDEKSKQLSDAYGRFADTGRDYVRTSPATSVLIALAAGFTLSKLFGRRH